MLQKLINYAYFVKNWQWLMDFKYLNYTHSNRKKNNIDNIKTIRSI